MKMRALLYKDNLQYRDDIPVPQRKQGEVLIKVHLAGICNTDFEILNGYLGFKGILGHEFVGEIVEADDKKLVGCRVVGEINISCGRCEMCSQGLPRHCKNIKCVGINNYPGVMADYIVLPLKNIHIVPEGVSDRQAVFTEPLAAGIEIIEQVHIKPSDRVVILGDGKLGLLTAQVLSSHNFQVEIIGRHKNKLEIAKKWNIETYFENDFSGQADVVIECTGNPGGLESALRIVRPRGVLVMKSTYKSHGSCNLSPLVVNEITCIGSRCGPFGPALRLLISGRISVEELISSEFPPEEGIRAFELARKRDSFKVLINFSET